MVPAFGDVTCASGYALNDDGQCVAHCLAGWYVADAGQPCVEIKRGSPYYSAAHDVVYGDTSGDNYKKCPDPDPNTPGGYVFINSAGVDYNRQTDIRHCFRTDVPVRYFENVNRRYCDGNGNCIHQMTTHGVVNNPCPYQYGDDGTAVYGEGEEYPCYGGSTNMKSCDAGFYAQKTKTGYSGRYFPCSPVGTEYYSPNGDLARYPCPTGTMTCGYGDCADSIDDCVPYKILHIDDLAIRVAASKYTTPALNIKMPDGNVFYGYTVVGDFSPALKFRAPSGGVYSVINPLDEFERVLIPAYNAWPAYTEIVIP